MKIKYDTTNTSQNLDRATLAIFDTDQAAETAITSSPLEIPIPEEIRNKPTQPTTLLADPWAPPTPGYSEYETQRPKFLTCEIRPSRHNHESAQRRNPYHSTYYVLRNSYQYCDLTKGNGIPLQELADGLMSRKRNVPVSIKRGIQEENERLGATSLMRLYEEGVEKGNAGMKEGEGEGAREVEGSEKGNDEGEAHRKGHRRGES